MLRLYTFLFLTSVTVYCRFSALAHHNTLVFIVKQNVVFNYVTLHL